MKQFFTFFCLAILFAPAVYAQDTVRFTGCTYLWKDNQLFKGTTIRVTVNGVGEYSVPTGPGKHCAELLVPVLGVPSNAGVSVFATKSVNTFDDRPLNGVSVGDLMKISCHVQGLAPLPTPHALLAADINRSGSVTTFDIVEGQKMLTGEYQHWPNNEVWRFPSAEVVYPDPTNPFGVNPHALTVEKLKAYHNDTIAILGLKTGDADGDSRLDGGVYGGPSPISDTLLLSLPHVTIPANTTVEIPVSVSSQSIGALQVEFMTKPGVNITEFVAGSLGPISPTAFRFGKSGPFNTARLLLIKPYNLPANSSPVFKIRIASVETVELKDVLSIGGGIPLLGFSPCPSKSYKLNLQFAGTLSFSAPYNTSLRATPATPNPFTDRALVKIELPETLPTLIEVFDLSGRLLWLQEQVLGSGEQQLEIPAEALPPGSMGLYRIRAGASVATGKVFRQ